MNRKIRSVSGLGMLAMAGVLSAQSGDIVPAPAFTADALVALPTDGWITNGGNICNQRYSPLTQINRDTVADLRALWRTGMGTGGAQNNSGQVQILAHEGTRHVINGAKDIFAVDVETGAIRWTYHGGPDSRAGSFISRSSRGVTLGDGKVLRDCSTRGWSRLISARGRSSGTSRLSPGRHVSPAGQFSRPFSFLFFESWKIVDGRIRQIEATVFQVPYKMHPGRPGD